MTMRLYLISQKQHVGYDTYDSAIVAATTEDEARRTHPSGPDSSWLTSYPSWATSPDFVAVKLIGTAEPGTDAGLILASFNAG